MVQEPPRTPPGPTGNVVAWRATLEQLRCDRLDQVAQLTQIPEGEDEVTTARLASLRAVVAEVDAALERLDRGRYGTCQRCETPIPSERLEIVPHARYCVTCQQSERR